MFSSSSRTKERDEFDDQIVPMAPKGLLVVFEETTTRIGSYRGGHGRTAAI